MWDMDLTPVRIDKWLWAARLVKTRALAVDAIRGGRVKLNGQPAKPSKDVKPGDEIEFSAGVIRLTATILGTAERRLPASEAVKLYEETEELGFSVGVAKSQDRSLIFISTGDNATSEVRFVPAAQHRDNVASAGAFQRLPDR